MPSWVFKTSPVGYQEIVSDPSYTFRAVVMTYPLIGNYGVWDEDLSKPACPQSAGLSCAAATAGTEQFPIYQNSGRNYERVRYCRHFRRVNTRCLARKLRNEGSQKGIITSSPRVSTQEALKRLERPLPRNAVSCVSTRKKWFSRTAQRQNSTLSQWIAA